MIERKERLDEVVYCDTGLEFPAMYEHIAKVREYVEDNGVGFVTLSGPFTFEDGLLNIPVKSKQYGVHEGYGWPHMMSRWCTRAFKLDPINKYLGDAEAVQAVGIAADEPKRLRPGEYLRYPLNEWGWTESVCLGYCYGKGFDWYDRSVGRGLYEIFDRTSCWICPLSSLDNLRNLRRFYPDLWAKIGELEEQCRLKRPYAEPTNYFKPRISWQALDRRFEIEERASCCQTSLGAFS